MASRQDPVAPHIPQRGTLEGKRGEVSTHRHTYVTDGARPEYGVLVHREYGLLSPEEPAGDPAAAETQGS